MARRTSWIALVTLVVLIVVVVGVAVDERSATAATESSAFEGDPVSFGITPDPHPATTITITYATSDGTAQKGVDYTETTGTFVFGPGDVATRTVSVPTIEDALVEGTETFTITFTPDQGTPATATGNILNDDPSGGGSGGGGGGGTTTTTTGPTTTTTTTSPPQDPTTRIAGIDRIETAIAASKDTFADKPAGNTAASLSLTARTAVLARADDYADALAGTPLAASKVGPLLLTPRDALHPAVKAEIQRILPSGSTVYILGGVAALAPAVEDELKAAGYIVGRRAGPDRYETAVQVAKEMNNPFTLLLATGTNFPDALSAGAAAAQIGGGVILSSGSTMPAATKAYLDIRVGGEVIAIGGPAAAAMPSAEAVVGADRYETATKVAQRFFTDPTTVGVASGDTFADSLAGGTHIAHRRGPLVLVRRDGVPSATAAYLDANAAKLASAFVYGGPAAVTDETKAAVQAAIT